MLPRPVKLADEPRLTNLKNSLRQLELEEIEVINPTVKVLVSPRRVSFPSAAIKDLALLQQSVSPDKAILCNALTTLADRVMTIVDTKGNTFLHLAVQHQPFEIVRLIIDRLGDTVCTLCKMVNFEGDTPLQLAHKFKDISLREKMIKLLLPLSLDHSVKPLSTLLNQTATVARYPLALVNKTLESNLNIGCVAINQCRQTIKTSSTHPDYNYLTPEEKIASRSAIENLRKAAKFEKLISFHNYRELIARNGGANCGELIISVLANILDMSMYRYIRLETMEIKNGDHAFIILDRAEDSKLEEFNTWGDKAVYVDPWSGVVSPVKSEEFIAAFKAFFSVTYNNKVNNSYTILTNFNRAFHALSVTSSSMANMSWASAHTSFVLISENRPVVIEVNTSREIKTFPAPEVIKTIPIIEAGFDLSTARPENAESSRIVGTKNLSIVNQSSLFPPVPIKLRSEHHDSKINDIPPPTLG